MLIEIVVVRQLRAVAIAACIVAVGVLTACREADSGAKADPNLTKLYDTYRNGEISECRLGGAVVYRAQLNAYDAIETIYDDKAVQAAACNYATGKVEAACRQVTDCSDVYRIKDNIWGRPSIDKYSLAK